MDCEIHHGDIGEVIVVLPIRSRVGSYETLACINCAKKSHAYCTKHEVPHGHWGEDLTRCHVCAEEMVKSSLWRGGKILSTIRSFAPRDYVLLHEEKCAPFLTKEQEVRVLLYFFISSALSLEIDLDDLIRRVRESRSLDFLKNGRAHVF